MNGHGSIRIASASDSGDIALVHVQAWRESYRGLVPDRMLASLSVAQRAKAWTRILDGSNRNEPDSRVYVAEMEGAVVGFGACGAQRDESLKGQGYDGEIGAIYVLRATQNLGLGKRLMVSMAKDLSERQFRGAALWVLRDNTQARRFYEFCGGAPVAEKSDERDGGVVLFEVAYGWPDLSVIR